MDCTFEFMCGWGWWGRGEYTALREQINYLPSEKTWQRKTEDEVRSSRQRREQIKGGGRESKACGSFKLQTLQVLIKWLNGKPAGVSDRRSCLLKCRL